MLYILFTLKILLAALCGGVVGWEREKIGKAAGPRTSALVAIGAAVFTMLSLHAFGSSSSPFVAAQIVTGIGFLCAGIILHKAHNTVEGLTTAAGLWTVAAVGMAIGADWFIEAGIVTIVMFVILSINDRRLTGDKK